MFISKILQEVAVHLSQHTVFLKPLSYSAPSSFRTFLLSPGSTNEHFFCATYTNPMTAGPRSVHLIAWYPMSKGDNHQTLLTKISRNGIITRCKKNFLHNFHEWGQWFPAFSQGCHSHHLLPFPPPLLPCPHSQATGSSPPSQCSPTTPAVAFPSLHSHFPTLRTSRLCHYFPSWCFQPKTHVEQGGWHKIHRRYSQTHSSHKLHNGFWTPAQLVASVRSCSYEFHWIIMQCKQKSWCQF